MAQAEFTITIKRKVVIDVEDDFDPYGEFGVATWAALSKSNVLVQHDDRDEVTEISAAWHHDY